ncbi:MAG: hypothetical protein JW993_00975 [Sedimentisphaerales bacterium]|nr:hypothetical protein [Sedimentisphaerales bacterium]
MTKTHMNFVTGFRSLRQRAIARTNNQNSAPTMISNTTPGVSCARTANS